MIRPVAPVFLDRDGTLVVEKHYLRDPAQAQLEAGVVEGLSLLRAAGHSLVVLSNQSGVGRGILTLDDVRAVNVRIEQLLRDHGIEILAWYICPHAPEAGCTCRKPATGLALQAARDWNLELAGSYMIGDKRADLELADSIGATGVLVTTGHGADHVAWARDHAHRVVGDLHEAARHIASHGGTGAHEP